MGKRRLKGKAPTLPVFRRVIFQAVPHQEILGLSCTRVLDARGKFYKRDWRHE
jgi:hypothetical protein